MAAQLERATQLQQLTSTTFDVLIIGGGATGLGVALDAAQRGLTTALIERGDWAGSTSGASTKLVHGGVRYLEQAFTKLQPSQFKLVYEGLHERRHMLTAAPHLAHSLGILLPVQSGWERFYYGAGLRLYEQLAGKRKVPAARFQPAEAVQTSTPALAKDAHQGGWLYYDGQFDDALYATALARTAAQHGCVLANHVAAEQPLQDSRGRVFGWQVRDQLVPERTLELRSHLTINCTGPQADLLRQQIDPRVPQRLRPSQGIHLVVNHPRGLGEQGVLIPRTDDGRIVFMLPWQDSFVLGTTDQEVSDPQSKPRATEAEIQYLLAHANRYLAAPLRREEVTATFAGYRPLVSARADAGTEQLSRMHVVEAWPDRAVINLMGGKWTSYRRMAQDAVDRALAMLKRPKLPCKTFGHPLVGAQDPLNTASDQAKAHWAALPATLQARLATYGDEAYGVAAYIDAEAPERLHPRYPFTKGEVRFLVAHTLAATIQDVMANRLRLALYDFQAAYDAAEPVADVLAEALNWSAAERAEALDAYRAQLREAMQLLQPAGEHAASAQG
jgi:glycerol-3-phosphate dehydrogenase